MKPTASTPAFKPRSSRRDRLAGLVLALLALSGAWACSDSSPTEPTETLTIHGTVEHQATSIHNFTMSIDGLMVVTLDSISPLAPDGTVISEQSFALGFSLGRQIEEICDTSGAIAMRPGDRSSYGLDQGGYCLYFYDAGFIPVDAAFEFTVRVEMTDF